jgi:hypothetical protein
LVLSLHFDSDNGRLSWARIVKNATTNGVDDYDDEKDASTLGCEMVWSTILASRRSTRGRSQQQQQPPRRCGGGRRPSV